LPSLKIYLSHFLKADFDWKKVAWKRPQGNEKCTGELDNDSRRFPKGGGGEKKRGGRNRDALKEVGKAD